MFVMNIKVIVLLQFCYKGYDVISLVNIDRKLVDHVFEHLSFLSTSVKFLFAAFSANRKVTIMITTLLVVYIFCFSFLSFLTQRHD